MLGIGKSYQSDPSNLFTNQQQSKNKLPEWIKQHITN